VTPPAVQRRRRGARLHVDGAGPGVVEGWLGMPPLPWSVVGVVVPLSPAPAPPRPPPPPVLGGVGGCGPSKRAGEDGGRGVGEGRCCCPLEVARAVAKVEVASASRVSSSRRRSLRMSWKEGNGRTRFRYILT
jgi:hypothetical protein